MTLDAESKQPLEDVFVVYHWEGTSASFFAATSTNQCYHYESAISGSDGAFAIPAWQESFRNWQHRKLDPKWYLVRLAYKPGYRLSRLSYEEHPQQYNLVYLEPYQPPESTEDQLWDLVRIIVHTECGDTAHSELIRKKMFMTIYRQADSLAKTDKQQKILTQMQYHIARILRLHENPEDREANARFFEKGAQW